MPTYKEYKFVAMKDKDGNIKKDKDGKTKKKQVWTGRWINRFSYKDKLSGETKRSFKRGFKTKKAGEEWEAEQAPRLGTLIAMTFRDYAEIYLEDAEARDRATTIRTKKSIFNQKLLPEFGDMILSDITPLGIRIWQTKLIKQGDSPTYLRRIHGEMSAAMNYAKVFLELTSENPCRVAGTMGSRRPETEMTIWSIEEFTFFYDDVKKRDPWKAFALLMLFWTGMRVGEMLALTPADIDFEEGTIRVHKTFHKEVKNGIRREWVDPPKTKGSIRTIHMNTQLSSDLHELVKKMYKIKSHERIFPFYQETMLGFLKRHLRRLGMREIRVHDLRHSHASMLLSNGVYITLVSERLGHDDVATTLNTYSHVIKKDYEQVKSFLDEAYG